MAEADSNPFKDGRSTLRETTKWMMSGIFGVAALIVGSSTISQLGSLGLLSIRFWVAAPTLLLAAGLCWIPFSRAISVLRSELMSLKDFAGQDAKQEYKTAFNKVQTRLGASLPGGKTLADFYKDYDDLKNQAKQLSDKQEGTKQLDNLKAKFALCREVCVAQLVSDRFDDLVLSLKWCGSAIIILFVVSVYAANPPKSTLTLADSLTLKDLTPAMNNDLVKQGLPPACLGSNAHLLAIAEPDFGQQTMILIPTQSPAGTCRPRKVTLFAGNVVKVD